MYELINTSLPNGLIAGSHGFATVAMTSGLLDTLRMRLEPLCAYRHRVSTHDATYFTLNPINWFHTILPSREHVIGRVAPADFDYTGRTNRLAHLLVFSAQEMPAIGGVGILRQEKDRLAEPWTGNARYLPPDRETVARLQGQPVASEIHLTHWRALLGDDQYVEMVQRLVAFLHQNIANRGRPIYFKTSAEHDSDGTQLLGLFTELINLLPPNKSNQATFMTYPASPSAATGCFLCGVYDHDPVFETISTTVPWVDCTQGIIHHAELLPPLRVVHEPTPPVYGQSLGVEQEIAHPAPRKVGLTNPRVSRPYVVPSALTHQPQYADILQPKAIHTLLIIITLLSIIALGVCAGAGWFAWKRFWAKSSSAPYEVNNAAPQAEAPTTKTDTPLPLPSAKNGNIQTNKTDEVSPDGGNKLVKLSTEPTKAKIKSAPVDTINSTENTTSIRKENLATPEKVKKAPPSQQVAPTNNTPSVVYLFMDATQIKQLAPNEEVPMRNSDKDSTNILSVCYYEANNKLKQQEISYTCKEIDRNKEYTPTPSFENVRKENKGCFLLWYKKDDQNTIYWEWVLDHTQGTWFDKKDTIDLNELCFGKEQGCLNIWNKLSGKANMIFSIRVTFPKGFEKDPTKELTVDSLLTLEKIRDQLISSREEIGGYRGLTYQEIEDKLDWYDKKIKEVKKQKKEVEKQKDKDERRKKEGSIKELEKEIESMLEEDKKRKLFNVPGTIRVGSAESQLKELKEELQNKKDGDKKYEPKNLKETLKKATFQVLKVKSKQEREGAQ